MSREATEARRRQATEQATPGSRLLLDAAFLVPSRRANAFRGALRRRARSLSGSGLVVSLTGPWPPYNFVDPPRRGAAALTAMARRPVGRVPRREDAPGADPARQRAQRRSGASPRPDAERVLDSSEASLLDIVDNVLNKGVVLSGDLTIALAQVDLMYARLSLLLCAADRVLPNEDADLVERHHDRRLRRSERARRVSRQ